MPPIRLADDRTRLPHRLGDGEAETLGEALLNDNVGAALYGVDHRRVLVDILHRQRGEVDAFLQPTRQRLTLGLDRGQDLSALRIVGDPGNRRPGKEQVGVGVPAVFSEATHDTDRVLELVPA